MRKLLILVILFSPFCYAKPYDYSDELLKSVAIGCFHGGGTKEFCVCIMNGITYNIPPSEIDSFNQSMQKFTNKQIDQIPRQHMIWIEGLNKSCK